MSAIDKTALAELLTHGQHRSLIGGKQLTLAFSGLYIASTTITSKPLLVWETEKIPYARYYVPIESLHPSIKQQLNQEAAATNSNPTSDEVQLEIVDTVKGKSNDSEAVIERLTVGPRKTTWVRFTEGALKGFIRFERKEMDEWFENGAIFAGIKNPYKRIDTTPTSSHVVVKIDGVVVAETNVAVQLNETGLSDAYYLPATSIKDWGMVEKSDWKTACPYKGEAWYFHLTVNGKKIENAVWYYQYPTHESDGVRGFVSFYNRAGVDISVDGVKVGVSEIAASNVLQGVHAVPGDRTLDIPWTKRDVRWW